MFTNIWKINNVHSYVAFQNAKSILEVLAYSAK